MPQRTEAYPPQTTEVLRLLTHVSCGDEQGLECTMELFCGKPGLTPPVLSLTLPQPLTRALTLTLPSCICPYLAPHRSTSSL